MVVIKDIADNISESHRITKSAANEIIKDIFTHIEMALDSGDTAFINGFGRFEVGVRAARKGRNPGTGQEIDIPARRVVKFKPAKSMREYLS